MVPVFQTLQSHTSVVYKSAVRALAVLDAQAAGRMDETGVGTADLLAVENDVILWASSYCSCSCYDIEF